MNDTITEKIYEDISHLSIQQKKKLIYKLLEDLTEEKTFSHDIRELEGLGAEIWQNIDAQEYVDKERESWT